MGNACTNCSQCKGDNGENSEVLTVDNKVWFIFTPIFNIHPNIYFKIIFISNIISIQLNTAIYFKIFFSTELN